MIKVSTISTFYRGGAGRAAFRLHEGLLQKPDIEPFFLQGEIIKQELKQANVITVPRATLPFYKKVLLKLGLETRQDFINMQTLINNPCNCEIATFCKTDFRVEQSAYVRGADIIHLHWVANFINFPTFFRNVNQPIVWTLHDMNPFQGIFHYKDDYLRNKKMVGQIDTSVYRMKRKAIHQHKNIHVVCLSKWLMEESMNSEILGRYPHYLIPNGLDFTSIKPIQKLAAQRKIGVNNQLKTLLFLAQDINTYRKGFDLLLTSLNNIGNATFNIITVGGQKIKLPDNFSHIHFEKIDNQSELDEIYVAADLTIICSREDNLPNVMLESFSNGTPVLSFHTGGMRDWIVNGQNGILVGEVGHQALSTAIVDFYNSAYSFDSDQIKLYAKAFFSNEKQAKEMSSLYKGILNYSE